jgi:hypothetical protein
MRRKVPRKKVDMARLQEEEEKTKKMEKEKGKKEKSKKKVKLHHRNIPLLKLKLHGKRKVSPQKSSARKKTRASKPELEATLIEDDISLVLGAMEDASEDILQIYGAKKEELYGSVEKELKEIQQAIQLICAVATVPSSSKTT